MHFLILLALLAVLIFGPQWWVRYVLAHYNKQEEDFPGTGGELARHLLRRFQLQTIKVVPAEGVGDHYDPIAGEVRLSLENMDRRSLTAIATAAHEVGHAIQHATDYHPFVWRQRLVRISQFSGRVGSFLLFAVPVLTLITKTPAAGLLMFLAAVGTLGISVLVQLLTLPVEWDASFGRALPILEAGYIEESQRPAVRRILRACALTYVASSLAGLLNFWRWMRLVKG